MQHKTVEHKIRKLRACDRIAQLEVQRVVSLCLKSCGFERLLDVGAGSGLFAETFAAAEVSVVGLDPDSDMIDAARYYTAGIDYCVGTAEALPFADDSFEALFMGMVLHETTDPLSALREARRVTQRDLAILEWPFPGTGKPLPARRFTEQQIDSMSRTAGFARVSIHRLNQVVLYFVQV
jgi:ubiquinone/menaquinone biosynthesis C-methylase UbiE